MAKGFLSVRRAKYASSQRRSTSYGNMDVLTELHKTVVGGRSVWIPKSLQVEGMELAKYLNETTELTGTEKRELAREYRQKVYSYDANWRQERLAHFLERMPDVVEGLLRADQAGFFNAEERQILDDIINNLSEMDDETRAEFFETEKDLFEDLADYYILLKRYGFGIGIDINPEEISDKDMEYIHSKGYSSWEDYRAGMTTKLRTIRRRTGQYLER